MKKLLFLLLGIMATGTLFLFIQSPATASAEDVIKLNLASGHGPQPFSSRAHMWWAQEVEKRTGGKVKIALHWGGSLASDREMVKLVGSGAVDMGESVWVPYNPQVFPLHIVMDGPVIWSKRPMALMYAGMQLEKEIPEVEAENTKLNLKRLTWQGAGVTNLMMKSKSITTIEDLKGLQIRTAGKFLQPPLIKAVGAVPVGIPMPELYDSMQKGMVDGATGTMPIFFGQKLHEIAKYQIEIGMGGDAGQGIMINLDKWKSLPPDVQQVIMELYEKDFPKVFVEKFAVPFYKKAFEIFKKNGVEVIALPDSEMEKWKALVPLDKQVEPWVKWTTKTSGLSESRVREILERYKDLANEFEKKYTDIW